MSSHQYHHRICHQDIRHPLEWCGLYHWFRWMLYDTVPLMHGVGMAVSKDQSFSVQQTRLQKVLLMEMALVAVTVSAKRWLWSIVSRSQTFICETKVIIKTDRKFVHDNDLTLLRSCPVGGYASDLLTHCFTREACY